MWPLVSKPITAIHNLALNEKFHNFSFVLNGKLTTKMSSITAPIEAYRSNAMFKYNFRSIFRTAMNRVVKAAEKQCKNDVEFIGLLSYLQKLTSKQQAKINNLLTSQTFQASKNQRKFWFNRSILRSSFFWKCGFVRKTAELKLKKSAFHSMNGPNTK